MVLFSIALTVGWLGAAACGAVVVARAGYGQRLKPGVPPGVIERIVLSACAFTAGEGTPAIYQCLGLVSKTCAPWLPLIHGFLVLTGYTLIARLMSRTRWGRRADSLLTGLLWEAMPAVAAAQQRMGERGGDLVERAQVALRGGRGREALQYVVRVRELVESAGIAAPPAWAEVDGQILRWQRGALSRRKVQDCG
ncbi:hypothetical protein [Kitasatospora sp. NPDC127060]|uniref:hypothetical protein n=1 Tax=Kitasatospora sp. NPDC127060 TaxID=3347121 RepID=UPI00366777BE